MRPIYGDDSPLPAASRAMRGQGHAVLRRPGQLAKGLLYAINGGFDEIRRDKATDQPLKVLSGIELNTQEVLITIRSFVKCLLLHRPVHPCRQDTPTSCANP